MNSALWSLFNNLQPEPEASVCPLCGRRNSRLTPCLECDGDAWTWLQLADHREGESAALRSALLTTLGRAGVDAAQAQDAERRAYQPGGCRLCPAYRRQVVKRADHRSVPLFLLRKHTLDGGGSMSMAYLTVLWQGKSWLAWSRALQSKWCGGLRSGSAYWIRAILGAALGRISARETIP